MKNVIFLVSGEKKPSGGGKIIYQFQNTINLNRNFSSKVIHIRKKKSKRWVESINKRIFKKKINQNNWEYKDIEIEEKPNTSWFDIEVKLKNNLNFKKELDHVILPEIYAHFANDFLIKQKIPYSIFVQNGYSIFSTKKYSKLYNAYKKAKFILIYSKDIKNCIKSAFPFINKKKFLNLVPSIDKKKLLPKKKLNLITYMPRKLSKHSELVVTFLKRYLPKTWKIIALDNLKINEVYDFLRKSKIFLSFSELEGLGLPPLEAALAGNKVIGYTGEAGKEYWQKPIFSEVKNGEILNFYKTILKNLNKKKTKKKYTIINKLSLKYSESNQKKSILRFLKKI